jgi:hypothetical protein
MTANEFIQKWMPKPGPSREDFIRDVHRLIEPPEDNIWVESTVSHRS